MTGKGGNNLGLLTAVALLIVVLAFFVPPIPQDPAYHLFADIRTFADVPHFGDVISSLALTLAGLIGLGGVTGARSQTLFEQPGDGLAYRVFFLAVAVIGLGSGYYHWQPTTERLFWDRLPMSVAFMAFFAAFWADRVNRNAGSLWVLAVAIAFGVASLVYWRWSESVGQGDLRPYGLVQFGPMLILPLMCQLNPEHRYTDGWYLAATALVYGLAILCARLDHQIFVITGGGISGHSLKHLIAAAACLIPLAMLHAATAKNAAPGLPIRKATS